MAKRKQKPQAKRRRIPNASRVRARLHQDGTPQPAGVAGRPSDRNPELEALLLKWLQHGGTLRSFCRLPELTPGEMSPVPDAIKQEIYRWIAANKAPPSHVTVHEWRKKDAKFAAAFDDANEIGFLYRADAILDIANTPCVGQIVTEETIQIDVGEGDAKMKVPATKRVVRSEDMLGHRKLQIEAHEKVLKVKQPHVWRAKLDVDHKSGGKAFDEALRALVGDGEPEPAVTDK